MFELDKKTRGKTQFTTFSWIWFNHRQEIMRFCHVDRLGFRYLSNKRMQTEKHSKTLRFQRMARPKSFIHRNYYQKFKKRHWLLWFSFFRRIFIKDVQKVCRGLWVNWGWISRVINIVVCTMHETRRNWRRKWLLMVFVCS